MTSHPHITSAAARDTIIATGLLSNFNMVLPYHVGLLLSNSFRRSMSASGHLPPGSTKEMGTTTNLGTPPDGGPYISSG
jgi:hypothetical protein